MRKTDALFWPLETLFWGVCTGLIGCSVLLPPVYGAQSAPESLAAEAREAEVIKQRMRDVADTIDNDRDIGAMHTTKDWSQHKCYALGVLLDRLDFVEHLKFKRPTTIRAHDREDAYQLRIQARSLDNFQEVVNLALKSPSDERTMEWNLDCVGHYRISGGFAGPRGDPKTTFFRVQNKGKVIQILGDIGPDFSSRLQSAINANPGVTTIALGSGGGYVREAIKAGRYIRSMHLETTLWNNCYSACPLVFLGGRYRSIHDPFPYLGFHKMSSETGPLLVSSPAYKAVGDYVDEMGASRHFVLDQMLSAEPSQMSIVRDATLCESNVATFIQRLCNAADYKKRK